MSFARPRPLRRADFWELQGGSRPSAARARITAATRQQPPGRDYQASHICGNSRCILAAHLRWQRRHTNNVLDGDFHSERNEGTTRYSRLRWGVSESYKLT